MPWVPFLLLPPAGLILRADPPPQWVRHPPQAGEECPGPGWVLSPPQQKGAGRPLGRRRQLTPAVPRITGQTGSEGKTTAS